MTTRMRRGRWMGLAGAAGLVALLPGFALAQGYTPVISPNPVTLTAGGETRTVTVATRSSGGFSDPIVYSFSGFPSGISTGGSRTVSPLPSSGAPQYPAVDFPFAATAGVAPGTYIGNLVGSSSNGTRSFPMTVIVEGAPPPPPPPPPTPPPPPPGDFSLSVSPPSVALVPGESAALSVTATGTGGFSEPILVSASGSASLSVQPSSFSLIAGGAQAVVVTASPTAPAGTVPLVFSGTAAGIAGPRTATTSVTVTEPLSTPVIDVIAPPSVVAGTAGNVLRVIGRNFEPGATITSGSPGVDVTGARVLGPAAAEVVVAVRPDARPGPYRLDLTNPDGGMATGGAMLLVYPAGALGAPLAVTAAAIVAPRPWQFLEPGQSLHALGLLATSGMGTIVGTWLLDGVPFDRFTRVVASGYPVEVRSVLPIPRSFTGEHRLSLVIESPNTLPPQEIPFFQAVESRTALRVLAPGAGATLDPDVPFFRWTLVPGASGYEVEIEDAPEASGEESRVAPGDGRPWTAVRRRVTDTEWRPEEALLEMLGAGAKRFRVRAVFPGEVMGEPTEWSEITIPEPAPDAEGEGQTEVPAWMEETSWRGAPFRLASTLSSSPRTPSLYPLARGDPASRHAAAPLGTAGRQDPGAEEGAQLAISLMSTTTTIASDFEDPPPMTRLQLSTQTDLRGQGFDQQATADLSGSQDIEDPWHAREESRNWLTRLGATQGGFREEFALGFAPPSFFDQTEFLTVAGSGGGLQGTFGSPAGRVSFYRSVDLSANGSFSAFEPEVRAAAYEASDAAGRFLFRTMWLDVTDPPLEGFSAAGQGRALGVIGAADFGPYLRLLGEAAGGDFEPGEGSFETARDGRAFRLSLGGAVGTFGYGLAAGRTGEGFVNPANRGFTPGGISDRTHAELTLQKALGQASLSGAYRHVRGGIAEAAGDPTTTENGATVRLALPIGQRVSVTAGGNVVGQRGDALDDLGLPATDRTQKGLDFGVTERLGPFSLTQALTWQDLDDEVHPFSEQTVTGLNLAASGTLTSHLNLATSVAHTRSEAAPEIGTTRQLLVSLQPSLNLTNLWLALTPRSAWTRVTNDLDDSEFRTDQYQLVARWSPPWLGAVLNLEVASDWNRSWSDLEPEPPSFDRRTVLTLTLNWRANRIWRPGESSRAEPLQVATATHRALSP